ncbi:MAG: hypothetical protein QM658_03320 [Gordonia sp. (in: high G+C Gram-positive bacteria)]
MDKFLQADDDAQKAGLAVLDSLTDSPLGTASEWQIIASLTADRPEWVDEIDTAPGG